MTVEIDITDHDERTGAFPEVSMLTDRGDHLVS